jgi:hypothetical protein
LRARQWLHSLHTGNTFGRGRENRGCPVLSTSFILIRRHQFYLSSDLSRNRMSGVLESLDESWIPTVSSLFPFFLSLLRIVGLKHGIEVASLLQADRAITALYNISSFRQRMKRTISALVFISFDANSPLLRDDRFCLTQQRTHQSKYLCLKAVSILKGPAWGLPHIRKLAQLIIRSCNINNNGPDLKASTEHMTRSAASKSFLENRGNPIKH